MTALFTATIWGLAGAFLFYILVPLVLSGSWPLFGLRGWRLHLLMLALALVCGIGAGALVWFDMQRWAS